MATLLERYPVVEPPPSKFDIVYDAFKKTVDTENAALSYEEKQLQDAVLDTGNGKGKKKGNSSQ